MDEYIDREAAIKTICEAYRNDIENNNLHGQGYNDGIRVACDLLRKAHTADVVPVVRCKFCKYSRPYFDLKVEYDAVRCTDHYFKCEHCAPDHIVFGDGYCQSGELKPAERAWEYDWENQDG